MLRRVVVIDWIAGSVVAAAVVGAGTELVTPIGFAHLSAGSPPERLGQTMGAAEVGRELDDAGGPLVQHVAGSAVADVEMWGRTSTGIPAITSAQNAIIATAITSHPAHPYP